MINDIQKKDGPNSHAAIEVFITHDSVIYSGEAKTSLSLNQKYLEDVTRKAFDRSGYIDEMRKFWSKSEVVLPDDMHIVNKIESQSPDIALGTTDKGVESGWNDQGVYFSSADRTNHSLMGYPMFLAQVICESLQKYSRASIIENREIKLGPDNKAVVTVRVAEDGLTPEEVTAVTVAVAHSRDTSVSDVQYFVYGFVKDLFNDLNVKIADDCQWVVNGTGRFVVHGPISDTSMTGRKISVNHPSAGPVWCNKMIGGGSLVKPWHASDLLLNITSRFIANVVCLANLSNYAVVGCAGAIGQTGLQSLFIKGDDKFEGNEELKQNVYEFFKTHIDWSPAGIAKLFNFWDSTFDFGLIVDRNFFGHELSLQGTPKVLQPWESGLIDDWAKLLQSFLRDKTPTLFD